MLRNNIIITGIPRSGTTLLTALLDCPPSSVAIGEPDVLGTWQKVYANDHAGFTKELIRYFADVRHKIKSKIPFKDRISVDGQPLTNYASRALEGRRDQAYVVADRVIEQVEDNFVLLVKAPVIFTSVLSAILAQDAFKVLAIIRDPVATLLSWNSVNFPISQGRLPAGEQYWPELRKIAEMESNVLDKQAMIWELFARTYLNHKEKIVLIRYEDMVQDTSCVANLLNISLQTIRVENMNKNPDYDMSKVADIIKAIEKYSPTAGLLYSY